MADGTVYDSRLTETPEGYEIRLAHKNDLTALPSIERDAAVLFKETAFELWVDPTRLDMVTLVAAFAEALAAGRLWVAVAQAGDPVGFIMATVVDRGAHVEEIDVVPAHGRRGLGGALLETVCAWASNAGFRSVTLSTFKGVPWNEPFYRRHGFEAVDPRALSPGFARIFERERNLGLRTDLRVMMRRDV